MQERTALDSSRSDPAGLDVGVAPRRSVRRRTVAAGLAWSVPVVLVGTPARAIAASSCPTLRYVLDASNPSYDEIRITNAGSTPLAAGTTITWVVYNRRAATSTLAIQSTTGVTAAPMFVGIASGGTGTITFTLSAPLAAGQTLSWRYTITGWNYASRVTINECPGATACLSSRTFTPGTDCPPAALVAGRAAAPTVFPDPAVIPPK